jgi:hypothetical protein
MTSISEPAKTSADVVRLIVCCGFSHRAAPSGVIIPEHWPKRVSFVGAAVDEVEPRPRDEILEANKST